MDLQSAGSQARENKSGARRSLVARMEHACNRDSTSRNSIAGLRPDAKRIRLAHTERQLQLVHANEEIRRFDRPATGPF